MAGSFGPFHRPTPRGLVCAALSTAVAIPMCGGCLGARHISIRADFPGANATVVGRGHGTYDIAIREDAGASTFHWFAFRIKNGLGQSLTFRIVNAARSAAPQSWTFARPSISSDGGGTWWRPAYAGYSAGVFAFTMIPRSANELVAYAPIYPVARWQSLVRSLDKRVASVVIDTIAITEDGHPVEVVTLSGCGTKPSRRSVIWLLARQHPAEVGGSWLLEGLMRWYTGQDTLAVRARSVASLSVVGIANPDGVERGHYRTDAAGRDIADHWMRGSDQASPVVSAIKDAIRASAMTFARVALVVDLHSHSTYRKNFAFLSASGDIDDSSRLAVEALVNRLADLSSDFTLEGSYRTILSMSGLVGSWATRELGAVGLILETTYHDLADVGRQGTAMTPARLAALGEALGKAIAQELVAAALPEALDHCIGQ